MRDVRAPHAPTGIGALTRKDRYREAMLERKIEEAYRDVATTSSAYRRRQRLRAARRHERALAAQRRRPQSALGALAAVLAVVLGAVAWTRASLSVAIVVGALLVIDGAVLQSRRRRLRRT